MAVARIKFPDSRAARLTAEAMLAAGLDSKAVREVGRAAERPGLMAELHADEMEALAPIAKQCPPRVRPLIAQSMEALRLCQSREGSRLRGDSLRAALGFPRSSGGSA